jgi:HEAT repeat protein
VSNFSQRLLIILAAVAISCGGIWYLQREWVSQDPRKIKVDPEAERRVVALLEETRGATYEKRMSIFYKILEVGRANVPVLVRALNDPDPEIRAFSANLLQHSKNPSVIPYLEAKLTDENASVRKSALTALGGLSAVETIPAIVLVLDDEDDFTRCQAAYVLGVLKDEQAVYPLVQLLEKDPYAVARQTAANSLGEIGDKHAVPPLINSLNDKNVLVRSASLVALNRITGAGLGPQKQTWADWWKQTHPPETPR